MQGTATVGAVRHEPASILTSAKLTACLGYAGLLTVAALHTALGCMRRSRGALQHMQVAVLDQPGVLLGCS